MMHNIFDALDLFHFILLLFLRSFDERSPCLASNSTNSKHEGAKRRINVFIFNDVAAYCVRSNFLSRQNYRHMAAQLFPKKTRPKLT